MKDSQIVDLYWHRDEHAIRETDIKYGAYCFTVAARILSDRGDAEECVNDTWLRAWNTIPPQKPVCLRMFLAKITRNLSFDKYKSRTAAKRGGGLLTTAFEELEECIPDHSDRSLDFQQQELADSIHFFLSSLPERERDVFLRRYFFMENISEIAKRFHLKESNVSVILSRTRAKLKSYLEKEGYSI